MGKKIMGSTTIPQANKQKYLQAWMKAKQTGQMPEVEVITKDMPIKEILVQMEKKGMKRCKRESCMLSGAKQSLACQVEDSGSSQRTRHLHATQFRMIQAKKQLTFGTWLD